MFRSVARSREMLLAYIMPMMQTYILPYSQDGYKEHVICLQQDVQSVATALPRTGRSVGVIRNNRYYSNVTIDCDVADALPQDSTLSEMQVRCPKCK